MCARYVITSPADAIRALFGYDDRPTFPPRYNVAPTQPIPIVRLDEGKRAFALVRWGFLPSWVKDPRTFSLLVNARGESVIDKPAFRNAMRRRRCLVPADGFTNGATRVRGVLFSCGRRPAVRSPLPGYGRPGPDRTVKKSTPRRSSPRGRTARLPPSMTACR